MRSAAPLIARICVAGAVCAALLHVAALATTDEPPAHDERAGEPAVLALLRAGDFARLEVHLAALQNAYAEGNSSDAAVAEAFAGFRTTDPEIGARLNEWLSVKPRSFAPYLARGEYLRHLGMVARARRSPEARDMADSGQAASYLTRAAVDLRAALARRADLSVAYASLVAVAIADGDSARADYWWRRGLTADPRSYALRRAYLLSLEPWQRPRTNPDDLLAVLENYLGYLSMDPAQGPQMAALQGFTALVTAEVLRRQRRHEPAESYYEEALSFGADWIYLRQQGLNRLQWGRAEQALESFERALRLRPHAASLFDLRARAHWALDRKEAALADWKDAVALDPFNPEILLHQAGALESLEQYWAAVALLDRAKVYGGDDPRIRAALGRLLLSRVDRPREAAANLRRATELEPGSPALWRAYAEALVRVRECEAAGAALATYQNLCRDGTRCPPAGLAWADSVLASARDGEVCALPDGAAP